MCIRLNNLSQIKKILKHYYQQYNNVMHRNYNCLLKLKSRQTIPIIQSFKMESFKLRAFFKNIEAKLDTCYNGVLGLLVHRVIVTCFMNILRSSGKFVEYKIKE